MRDQKQVLYEPAWQRFNELKEVERHLGFAPTPEDALMRKGELDLRRVTAHLRAAFLLGASRFNPLFAEIDHTADSLDELRTAFGVAFWGAAAYAHLRAHELSIEDAAFLNGDNWCLYTLMEGVKRLNAAA